MKWNSRGLSKMRSLAIDQIACKSNDSLPIEDECRFSDKVRGRWNRLAVRESRNGLDLRDVDADGMPVRETDIIVTSSEREKFILPLLTMMPGLFY
jgi:hypothetical protein